MCFPRSDEPSSKGNSLTTGIKLFDDLSPDPTAVFPQLDSQGLTVPFGGGPGRCFPQLSHELASARSESGLPAAEQLFKTIYKVVSLA